MPTESGADKLLEVGRLKKYFPVRRGFFQRVAGWIKAVDDVSFDITRGTTLGLVGESGCGKTTVGRTILRLIEPDEGRVAYKGRDLGGLSSGDMRFLRKEMQIVFQDPFGSLNPRMTVGGSIEEGLRVRGVASRSERKERAEGLLEMVGMAPASGDRYPHEFSGGQRQRIGIARALSVEPSLIVCDEPVSALDVSIQAQIVNLLMALQENLKLSYLFISHDLNVVGYASDAVAVMYLGQIMECGASDAIFENPLHPYTVALLSAAPSAFGVKGARKRQILSGDVPSPFNPPPGCKFQGRCPLVEKRCRRDTIDLETPEKGHIVRCWKVV
jgi:oligopeptide transport system ATP-binding protein